MSHLRIYKGIVIEDKKPSVRFMAAAAYIRSSQPVSPPPTSPKKRGKAKASAKD
jgi:hypothetical protein